MATILDNMRQLFQEMKKKKGTPAHNESSSEMNSVFRFRYAQFKDLLTANSKILNVLSDMDEKLKGENVFGYSYITSQSNRSLRQAFKMVKCLNVMSNGKYRTLYTALEKISEQIKEVANERKVEPPPSNILLYSAIELKSADWVGGKNANLGEMSNRLNIPIPAGFAITTRAFASFIKHNDLDDEIAKLKNLADINEYEQLDAISSRLIQIIKEKPLPPGLENEIATACASLWGDDQQVLVAMRSSAVGEDGDLSYAGQYLTLLGLTRDRISEAYKTILSSLYSTRSISYRFAKGVYDEDLTMSVACLQMVDSIVSGVMYTSHPYDILDENILINAIWGLGPYAVDGIVTPDAYTVSKDPEPLILAKKIAIKPIQLVLNKQGGTEELPVPEEKMAHPCLTDEQILSLAGYGAALERHYKSPQDIEWALDREGNLIILQSRPLNIKNSANFCLLKTTPLQGYKLLLDVSEIACQGVGKGAIFHVDTIEDLAGFPPGAILLARHSSPEYVIAMRTCSAIIVEAGSVSGHMAALAREFNIPTLITCQPTMNLLPAGLEVTVDGYTGRVYEGVVSELLEAVRKDESHMKGSPVHEHLKRISQFIIPLNLTNPATPDFSPEGCKTLHDLARFCHEYSYKEMFQISDLASKHHGWSMKLEATLPMDIHLIDLGDGIKEDALVRWNRIKIDQIKSIPFIAMLQGMMNRDVFCPEPRPINLSGLFSVMKEQTITPGHVGQRFGDRSYAIIAEKYLNFSSRVGYHYSVVDAYCGETINKNYITFSFKGGAADSVRRNRRVRAIALILDQEGFKVNVKGDKVDARLQKYPKSYIESRMDILGKLLIFTRQLDMLMTSEKSVEWVAENFVAGNYKLSVPANTALDQ